MVDSPATATAPAATAPANTQPSEAERVLTIQELIQQSKTTYKTIPGFEPGTVIRIGSLKAGDMIEWTEANEANDGERKKYAGLLLIARSMVDANNNRQAPTRAAQEQAAEALKAVEYSKSEEVLKGVLALNGMTVVGGANKSETKAEADGKKG
jgi:hypothetical protein